MAEYKTIRWLCVFSNCSGTEVKWTWQSQD